MSEEEIKDVIDYIESICNGICSTEEEGLEIKRYIEQLQQENIELRETIKADEKANLILANDNKMLRRSKKNAYQEFKKKHNSLYKQRIDKAIEYNKQVIGDIKSFYRPTRDTIYSGDAIIYIAEENISVLEGDK